MADILIPGMEMPEYCYECPCHNGESGYCQLSKDKYLSSIERPAKCPLVEIPTPHGRLIDAEMIEQGGAHPLHFWRPTCKNPLCAGYNFKRYCNAEIAAEAWNRRANDRN